MKHAHPTPSKNPFLEWIRSFLIAAAIILPLKSSLADWNWVPSGSMKPTILEGDMVLVNKLAYDLKIPFTRYHLSEWGNPLKGDIVVFFSPKDGVRLVKRVIAGPGDSVEMRNNVLFVNGQAQKYSLQDAGPYRVEIYEDRSPIIARESGALPSHFVMALPSRPALRSFPTLTVPPGKYFMMGDSRDNSNDSRFIGLVDRRQIVGRASRVVLSFDKNHLYIPRFDRFFAKLDS